MTFQIPESLSQFSVAGLEDLLHQARTEYDSLLASVTADTVTDEQLDQIEALQEFARITVPGEFSARTSRKDRFAAINEPEVEPEPEQEPEPEPEPELELRLPPKHPPDAR